MRALEAPVVAICQRLHFTQTSWAGPPELVLSCPHATMYPEVAAGGEGCCKCAFGFACGYEHSMDLWVHRVPASLVGAKHLITGPLPAFLCLVSS